MDFNCEYCNISFKRNCEQDIKILKNVKTIQ